MQGRDCFPSYDLCHKSQRFTSLYSVGRTSHRSLHSFKEEETPPFNGSSAHVISQEEHGGWGTVLSLESTVSHSGPVQCFAAKKRGSGGVVNMDSELGRLKSSPGPFTDQLCNKTRSFTTLCLGFFSL